MKKFLLIHLGVSAVLFCGVVHGQNWVQDGLTEDLQELYYDVRIFKLNSDEGHAPVRFGGGATITIGQESKAIGTSHGLREFSIGGSQLVLDGKGYYWDGLSVEENDFIEEVGQSRPFPASYLSEGLVFNDYTPIQYFFLKPNGKSNEYQSVSYFSGAGMTVKVGATKMAGKPVGVAGNLNLLEPYSQNKNRKVSMSIDASSVIRYVKERTVLDGTSLPVGIPIWDTAESAHELATNLGDWTAFVTAVSNQFYLVLLKPDYPYADVVEKPSEAYTQFAIETAFLELRGKRINGESYDRYANVQGFENALVFKPEHVIENTNHISSEQELYDVMGEAGGRFYGFQISQSAELLSRPRVTDVFSKKDVPPGYPENLFKVILPRREKGIDVLGGYGGGGDGSGRVSQEGGVRGIAFEGPNFLAPEGHKVNHADYVKNYFTGMALIMDVGYEDIPFRDGGSFSAKKTYRAPLGMASFIKGYIADEPGYIDLNLVLQWKGLNPYAPKRLVGVQAVKDALDYVGFIGTVKIKEDDQICFLHSLSDERHILVWLTATKIDRSGSKYYQSEF